MVDRSGSEMFPFLRLGNGCVSLDYSSDQYLEGSHCPTCNAVAPNREISDGVIVRYRCANPNCAIAKGGIYESWYVCTACLFTGKSGRIKSHRPYVKDKHVSTKKHLDSLASLEVTFLEEKTSGVLPLEVSSRKRDQTSSDRLRKELGVFFSNENLVSILWYELGMGRNCMEPLVMASCFPNEFNREADTAAKEDLIGELRSAYNYFQMSRDMRERVMVQCLHSYNLGRRHEHEDTKQPPTASHIDECFLTGKPLLTGATMEQQLHSQAFFRSGRPPCADEEKRVRRICPPRNLNELSHRYLSSGVTSLTELLPIPPVAVTPQEDHAITRPQDCILDFLAHGCPLQVISPSLLSKHPASRYSWITESPRAREIISLVPLDDTNASTVNVLVLPYLLWRDDFEANNSTKKKGSTWMFTMTIAPTRHTTTCCSRSIHWQ